jgi:hypothetical protein
VVYTKRLVDEAAGARLVGYVYVTMYLVEAAHGGFYISLSLPLYSCELVCWDDYYFM